ncbi:TonB-dependent receptor [Photobacterium sp. MCCC 1A19761]|uniref:TonB-dependent receptor n=1 Tax=Photobacterium sp. MCCC 1A19761 TaxID=3115000 RepID=UPI00307E0A06
MDRRYILSSFCYAILGLMLGIYMAMSNNHGQLVTHAHMMLVGFVVSFIYGLCHKLWLTNGNKPLAKVQFWIHHVAAIVLFIGLFLLYGKFVAAETLEPILGMASIAVLVGLILMTVLFAQSGGRSVSGD